MRNALVITEKQSVFLKENRQDPITGDEFCLGDKVVFCASCKSAFLADSWEYMNGRHCEQVGTLRKFPVVSKLKLSKPIILDFRKANTGNRIFAYVIDTVIAIALAVFMYAVLDEILRVRDASVYSFFSACFYMFFRDIFGVRSSFGKRIMGLYFIDTETHKIAHPLKLVFRNIFYWICLFAAISLIAFLEAITDTGIVGGILGVVLFIANIVHVFVVLADQNHIFDKILKIELVEKNKT
ncbi:RDD family protein [Bernardetia sp.]|uniref:RDD family protein n=1 Tax=Bernardetia sp. TaxID=1937974 RepID=UPI0025B80C81|nr:RDD family protein [Bernardetia sp.]